MVIHANDNITISTMYMCLYIIIIIIYIYTYIIYYSIAWYTSIIIKHWMVRVKQQYSMSAALNTLQPDTA